MKTTNLTNLEISKKLKEIGFEADTLFYWTKVVKFKKTDPDIDCITIICENEKWRLYKTDVPAYDLETLLDALPKKIQFKQKEYCFWMQWSGCSDCLLLGYVYGNLRAIELEVWQLENESLADTAGRMLIKLYEAGIINFNK